LGSFSGTLPPGRHAGPRKSWLGSCQRCGVIGFGALVKAEGKTIPFDGVGFGFDERMSKIDRVIDLLATRAQWCKGRLSTYDGRHCIRGAIMAVDGLGTLRPVVLRAINEVTGHHYWSIEKFNDDPDTHHAQVVAVLARARTDLAVGHLAAIRARPPAPGGWGRRMVGWINRRGC
jgi:hypothetical protein